MICLVDLAEIYALLCLYELLKSTFTNDVCHGSSPQRNYVVMEQHKFRYTPYRRSICFQHYTMREYADKVRFIILNYIMPTK